MKYCLLILRNNPVPARETSHEELRELFLSLGLRDCRRVLVHSALFTLGRIIGGVKGFHETLRSVVGEEATIIAPTFTYSFRRGEPFDVRNTPASGELGAYAEYLRNQEDSWRSPCPLFSFSAQGPDAEKMMQRRSIHAFGHESVYETLFDLDTRMVALGITYSTGLSGFMHIEKLAQVDYRYDLHLVGKSIGPDGEKYDDEAIHYARDEVIFSGARTNREPVGRMLEDAGIAVSVPFGSGKHFALNAAPFQSFVLPKLRQNPHLMLVAEN